MRREAEKKLREVEKRLAYKEQQAKEVFHLRAEYRVLFENYER